MIKPIIYSDIREKNVIEREMFSKLSPAEKRRMKKSWMALMDVLGEARSVRKRKESRKPASRRKPNKKGA